MEDPLGGQCSSRRPEVWPVVSSGNQSMAKIKWHSYPTNRGKWACLERILTLSWSVLDFHNKGGHSPVERVKKQPTNERRVEVGEWRSREEKCFFWRFLWIFVGIIRFQGLSQSKEAKE